MRHPEAPPSRTKRLAATWWIVESSENWSLLLPPVRVDGATKAAEAGIDAERRQVGTDWQWRIEHDHSTLRVEHKRQCWIRSADPVMNSSETALPCEQSQQQRQQQQRPRDGLQRHRKGSVCCFAVLLLAVLPLQQFTRYTRSTLPKFESAVTNSDDWRSSPVKILTLRQVVE